MYTNRREYWEAHLGQKEGEGIYMLLLRRRRAPGAVPSGMRLGHADFDPFYSGMQ
jgi:hypothetical protein